MDPLTLIGAVSLVVGGFYIDRRGISAVEKMIDKKMIVEVLDKPLSLDVPVEKVLIDFNKKNK
jgi:hypothetical protein